MVISLRYRLVVISAMMCNVTSDAAWRTDVWWRGAAASAAIFLVLHNSAPTMYKVNASFLSTLSSTLLYTSISYRLLLLSITTGSFDRVTEKPYTAAFSWEKQKKVVITFSMLLSVSGEFKRMPVNHSIYFESKKMINSEKNLILCMESASFIWKPTENAVKVLYL